MAIRTKRILTSVKKCIYRRLSEAITFAVTTDDDIEVGHVTIPAGKTYGRTKVPFGYLEAIIRDGVVTCTYYELKRGCFIFR